MLIVAAEGFPHHSKQIRCLFGLFSFNIKFVDV